jgi:hypothetical protein
MPQLSADRYAADIEASTTGLAEIVAEHDQSLPIPTCPEWTLRQLVTHVGRAHRRAAEITSTRSDTFGLTVEPGHSKADAALTGPAASLLLVLMRRRPVPDRAVTVYGDSAVADGWLASTAF